ncbi:MAG: M28 family peptidase [Bryobacteraceae bacterium]
MKTFARSALLAGAAQWAAWSAQDIPALLDVIGAQVRPTAAMDNMRTVWSTDRWFTFPRFAETARNMRAMLRDAGARDTRIVDAPADGVSQFGYWTMPMAWDVRSATLIVETSRQVLADYSREPASLCMWSGPTPSSGLSAPLVEYEPGADVRGKFVLTKQNPAGLKHELVRAGVAGVVNGFSENPDLRAGRQWINAWGDAGWAFTAASTPLPCFSVTPAQAGQLRAQLAAGDTVRLRAHIDSRYYKGAYPYVTGVIRGASSKEEVLLLGHAFEQGAHDNATGVAAMIEAMAALHRAIALGAIPPPKRTIRVLLMGEYYGTHHYIASNPERVQRTIGAFCLDTPAAAYEAKGTEYTFHLNPHSGAAYTDVLIEQIAAAYFSKLGRPWKTAPFMPGTDSFLGEPSIAIPTTWPYSGTGVHSHHNSMDTPDTVDPRSLRDLTVVSAAYVYYLANAGPDEARILRAKIEERFASGARREVALASLARLAADPAPAGGNQATPAGEPTSGASGPIPRRLRFGTIPLDDLPVDQREGFPSGAWATRPGLALYWADGKRTIAQIAALTEEEAGKSDFNYEAYFRFLARKGYVAIAE